MESNRPINLNAVESEIEGQSSAHRPFFVPIVRAIATLGGKARKRDVQRQLRTLLKDEFTALQLDYLEANNRYGWVRLNLRNLGLVTGEYGYWELTELGKAYAERHANDAFKFELDIPEVAPCERSDIASESVAVTAYRAYEVPVLSVMAGGITARGEIIRHVGAALQDKLLPTDSRIMPNGDVVWQFRTAWAISNLSKEGCLENTGTGQWAITSAGRERLAREESSWDIEGFRDARAIVRAVAGQPGGTPSVPPPSQAWSALRKQIPKAIFHQLDARLLPDLGPKPETPIARNVILYGPPGTGKTHLAKAVGRALTGEREVREDGRFRLLQFHPSYAYEDFVQGVRPDLKQTQLRYQLQKGPFLRIAEAAAQQPDQIFVLVIDEINRGDPARIFGELLYALEYRDEPVTLPLGGELVVPSNLVIIGTMNSVDRSVGLVDYALRRRFGFVRVDPQREVVGSAARNRTVAEIGPTVLDNFNRWLQQHLSPEHVLGHSFFLGASGDWAGDPFERLWQCDIRPLMEEYFYGDLKRLAEANTYWNTTVRAARDALATLAAESTIQEARRAAEPVT